MFSMQFRIVFLVLWLITACLVFSREADTAERYCQFTSTLSKTQHYAHDISLWEVNSPSRSIACAVRCLKDARCGSFVMSRDVCRGVKSRTGSGTKGLLPVGSRRYAKMCNKGGRDLHLRSPPESSLGERCESNTDCVGHGLICHLKKCQCLPELLYSPTAGTCGKCDSLGNTFTIFDGYRIEEHNGRVIETIFSGAECRKLCLEETSFRCRMAKYLRSPVLAYLSVYKVHTCILSDVTFGGVPKSERSYQSMGWSMYLRECE